MTSAEHYAAMIDANNKWTARSVRPTADRWGGGTAERFKLDPRRPLSPDQEVVAGYLGAEDVLVDVGGGAGRLGLPLALRCKEVVNAEPSPGMQAAFKDAAASAGITNVRSVQSDWLSADGVTGDLCMANHVTYFIRDIEPFLWKLHRAARNRVIIGVNSVANPNSTAPFVRLLYGEEYPGVPGFRELLPVLWDMRILPEVRVLPQPYASLISPTPERAIEQRVTADWIRDEDRDRAQRLFTEHYDELFCAVPGGVQTRDGAEAKGIFITWVPGEQRV